MIRITFLLIGLFAFIRVFPQNSNLIKTEKINNRIWNFYAENENSILVNIVGKKGKVIEIRRYSDINLTTEIGEWTEYYPNMTIKAKRYFDHGFPTGTWIQYSKEGDINNRKDYAFELLYATKDTVIIKSNLVENKNKDIKNEKMPQFNGGSDALMKFILNELIHSDYYIFDKYNSAGRIDILVKFTIDIDGSLINIRVVNQNKKILEKDAVRVVKKFPKWSPGYNSNNEPCKVDFTLPIVYIFPKE